jgi:acyl carrier protein
MSATVATAAESPWFSGHFPGDPILPGIAQLKMVADLISASGPDVMHLTGLSRVKFRKIVRPDEKLDIQVTRTGREDQYIFKITSGDEEVCSGRMFSTQHKKNGFMTSDISKTITRIAEIIINELKLEDITPETFDPDLDLVDEVGIDSMDLATVVLVLRDEYGVRIDEDDYPKLTTVRIIAGYINDKLSGSE